jgi:hypothetical protein
MPRRAIKPTKTAAELEELLFQFLIADPAILFTGVFVRPAKRARPSHPNWRAIIIGLRRESEPRARAISDALTSEYDLA